MIPQYLELRRSKQKVNSSRVEVVLGREPRLAPATCSTVEALGWGEHSAGLFSDYDPARDLQLEFS